MKTALIVGASRGLGLGLVKGLIDSGWEVIATVRDVNDCSELRLLTGVQIERLDVCDTAQLELLVFNMGEKKIDLLFLNSGIFGPAWQSPQCAEIDKVGHLFMTNAIGPIRVAERFVHAVRAEVGVIAFMTTRLGNAESPDQARAFGYKASKAALNYLIACFAGHLASRQTTVLGIYPGWVNTDMGGSNAPLDVATSVLGMVKQLGLYRGAGGVHFISHTGEVMMH